MATKRKMCGICRTHTIVRKVTFAPRLKDDSEPEIAWICSPCVIELESDEPSNKD